MLSSRMRWDKYSSQRLKNECPGLGELSFSFIAHPGKHRGQRDKPIVVCCARRRNARHIYDLDPV